MDARHTLEFLAPSRSELILDAGCGTGRNLKHLLSANGKPVGIDSSAGMLSVARRCRPGVPLVMADLERDLPFYEETFDAVLCALIGEHLGELPASCLRFIEC